MRDRIFPYPLFQVFIGITEVRLEAEGWNDCRAPPATFDLFRRPCARPIKRSSFPISKSSFSDEALYFTKLCLALTIITIRILDIVHDTIWIS